MQIHQVHCKLKSRIKHLSLGILSPKVHPIPLFFDWNQVPKKQPPFKKRRKDHHVIEIQRFEVIFWSRMRQNPSIPPGNSRVDQMDFPQENDPDWTRALKKSRKMLRQCYWYLLCCTIIYIYIEYIHAMWGIFRIQYVHVYMYFHFSCTPLFKKKTLYKPPHLLKKNRVKTAPV